MAPKKSSNTYIFLRALSLRLLLQIPWFRRFATVPEKVERPKTIIDYSRRTALLRCIVHLCPVSATIAILGVNLHGIYLGRNTPGPVLPNSVTGFIFQIMAKLHELLIVASLTNIIFTLIRGQLVSGDGLPLGLVASGFNFPTVSFFWSQEFWAAATSKLSVWSRIKTMALLLVAGLITATCGPASAILMLPRVQDWTAGGSDYYLPGTRDEIFPRKLTALSPNNTQSLCLERNAYKLSFCPSGGFFDWLSFVTVHPIVLGGRSQGSDWLWDTTPISGAIVDSYRIEPTVQAKHRGQAYQTSATAPLLLTLAYQAALFDGWHHAVEDISYNALKSSQSEYDSFLDHLQHSSSPQPVVRTLCSPAQNSSGGENVIDFPILPSYSCSNGTRHPVDLSPQLHSAPSSEIRVTWHQLPAELGSASAGLVFEAPWLKEPASRVVVGCTIDARWANATTTGAVGIPHPLGLARIWGDAGAFRPVDDGTWHHIELDRSWLDTLSPATDSLTGEGDRNVTTFEQILATSAILSTTSTNPDTQEVTWNNLTADLPNRTLYLETLTTLLVVDGISRFNSDRFLDTTGLPYRRNLLDDRKRPDFKEQILNGGTALSPPPNSTFSTFHTTIVITGLTYRLSSVTDYVSVSILLLHALLAVLHTLYSIKTKESSMAWDSIVELLMLAQNSRPTPALYDSSAGITCTSTYRQVAVIRASEPVESGTGPTAHVEIIFPETRTDQGRHLGSGGNAGSGSLGPINGSRATQSTAQSTSSVPASNNQTPASQQTPDAQ